MQTTSCHFVIRKKMQSKHIQLPFGVVKDKSKENNIKLILPPNFRKDVLFDQLPYLSHLENLAIVDIVKNGIVDDLSLQKYLLTTGLLKNSIQDSLDMIISSDEKLSDAAVRRQLNTKFLCVQENLIPSMQFLKIKQSLILIFL